MTVIHHGLKTDENLNNFFVYDCGLIIQIVIYLFFTTTVIVFEVKIGILCINISARSS